MFMITTFIVKKSEIWIYMVGLLFAAIFDNSYYAVLYTNHILERGLIWRRQFAPKPFPFRINSIEDAEEEPQSQSKAY